MVEGLGVGSHRDSSRELRRHTPDIKGHARIVIRK